nr:OB-fold nucleic acid binding domain-containing protein [Candidatus Njordarchaeum guaymaensis]
MKKLPRMTLEEIINKIVEEKGLSRKQVFDLIEKKKITLSWMISDEGAADIIAKELGVEALPGFEGEDLSLTIGDLVAGMSNVTITGRIAKVKPLREFVDKSGNKGIVTNLTLVDKSGDINVVLWGEPAKHIQDSRANEGDIIRIRNGYVREDLGGRVELHVGKRGHLEINPSDIREIDFPKHSTKTMKIRDLTADINEADITGIVQEVYGVKVVQTKDGREAKLSSLILADETGEKVRVVFWNDRTSLMENVRNGYVLEVTSGRVRANRNGEIEVHVNPSATVKVNPPNARNGAPATRDVCEGSQIIHRSTHPSEGLIAEEPKFREFARSNGETGKILSFILSDKASSIRVVAWGENAERLRRLKKGDFIRIKEGNFKRGIKGELEIHIKDLGSLEVRNKRDDGSSTNGSLKNTSLEVQQAQDKIPRKRICELRDGESAEIRGMITRVQSKTPVYRACPKCFRKVSRQEGEWLCPKDGSIDEPTMRVLYSLTLDDGTGTIPCTLSGKLGEELLETRIDDMLPSIDDEAGENKSIFSKILGIEIILVGRSSPNRKSNLNKSEFNVTKVIRPDPRTEAKILLERIKNEFTI